MRLGETFANLITALLLMSIVCCIFLLFGKPLWPQRYARMVLLPNISAATTGSTRSSCGPDPCRPTTFNVSLAPPALLPSHRNRGREEDCEARGGFDRPLRKAFSVGIASSVRRFVTAVVTWFADLMKQL
jgi:hypothetical protein